MHTKLALSLILLSFSFTSNLSFAQSSDNKFSVQGFYGGAFPVSSLSNDLTNDFSWGAEIEYKFAKSTHALISFSVNDFSTRPDFYIDDFNDYSRTYQYTAGIKHYFPMTKNFFTYGKGQAGLYNVREFDVNSLKSHNSFGLNAGAGVLYKYDKTFGAFAEAVLHNVFVNENLRFVTLQGGIKFDF